MGTEDGRNGGKSGSENGLTGSGLNLVDVEGMVGLGCLVDLGTLVDSTDEVADDSIELIRASVRVFGDTKGMDDGLTRGKTGEDSVSADGLIGDGLDQVGREILLVLVNIGGLGVLDGL